jgi:transporter family protein
LATAIRTIVVVVMAWAIVFITGRHNDLVNISQKNLLFLILSGIATGLSWLWARYEQAFDLIIPTQ